MDGLPTCLGSVSFTLWLQGSSPHVSDYLIGLTIHPLTGCSGERSPHTGQI